MLRRSAGRNVHHATDSGGEIMKFFMGMVTGALCLTGIEAAVICNAREFYMHQTADEKFLQLNGHTVEIDRSLPALAKIMANLKRHKP